MIDTIKQFFLDIFQAVIDFLLWAPIKLLELFLDGITAVISSIDPPDFVNGTSLGDYIDPDILWMVNQSGVGDALTIISGAIAFRFLRRVLTLGIW